MLKNAPNQAGNFANFQWTELFSSSAGSDLQAIIQWQCSFFSIFFFSFLEFNCPGDGNCSNQGICDDSTGICNCDSGFEGQSCQGKMIKKTCLFY